VRRLRTLSLLLLAAGTTQLGAGWWLPMKAAAAQALLRVAWARTRMDGQPARPWPWARHWPVARLRVPAHGIDQIVLAGTEGASLAFGPGHLDGTPLPGEPGNAVLAGHRDTSFRFLSGIRPGELLLLETSDGRLVRYRVEGTSIVFEDDPSVAGQAGGAALTLVTCYPFDAVRPGTRLRYVVRAVPAAAGAAGVVTAAASSRGAAGAARSDRRGRPGDRRAPGPRAAGTGRSPTGRG
jgi:sortase A